MEEDFGGSQGITKGCGAKGRRRRRRRRRSLPVLEWPQFLNCLVSTYPKRPKCDVDLRTVAMCSLK